MKLICMALAISLAFSGCSLPKKPSGDEGNKRVDQIDQAASLHTSITSITRWDDIKDKLKPGFVLSANDALSKSIPTTLVRLDRVLEILRFQLAVTPSITKQSSTTTTSSGSGKDPTTTSDATIEKNSPALPTVVPPTALTASAPSTLVAPDSPADALLQYQSAANLLRDIAVLNAEVDNISRRSGQDAYLTRIQVSVMPLQHGLGYDVYANIAMFASNGAFDPELGTRTVGQILPVAPLIIPILSTDTVQATRRSKTSTAQREIGLALNLLKGFGSVGASLGSGQENESDAAGSDLESVVTVGRLSDNTIRIRLGADPLPGGGYGMVPRTFNISAVVFMPKAASQLEYVSRLSLHHVLDGSELSTVRSPTYDQGLMNIADRYGDDFPGVTASELKTYLDAHTFHGDFAAFTTRIEALRAQEKKESRLSKLESNRKLMYMWSELIALNRQSRFASSVVDLPKLLPMQWPSNAQLVSYSADAKGVTVSLGMGNNLRGDSVDAVMSVGSCMPSSVAGSSADVKPKQKPAGQAAKAPQEAPATSRGLCRPTAELFSMEATSVTPTKDGRGLTMVFPPIEGIQRLDNSKELLVPVLLRLSSTADSPPLSPPPYAFIAAVATKTDSAEPKVDPATLIPESKVVRAKDGKGSIAVFVQGGDKSELSIVVHASVVAMADDAGKPVAHKGNAWPVVNGGRYVLSLENLSSSNPIQFELMGLAAQAKKPSSLYSTDVRVEEIAHK